MLGLARTLVNVLVTEATLEAVGAEAVDFYFNLSTATTTSIRLVGGSGGQFCLLLHFNLLTNGIVLAWVVGFATRLTVLFVVRAQIGRGFHGHS